MAASFHAELVTPERVLFSGDAEEVSLRSDGGEISFLAGHEDYIGAVDITAVNIQRAGTDASDVVRAAVHGGFVHVSDNKVVILAGVAELAPEIDVERARRALDVAEARVGESAAGTDHSGSEGEAQPMQGAMLALLAPESPEAAVRRARTRLDVAGGAERH